MLSGGRVDRCRWSDVGEVIKDAEVGVTKSNCATGLYGFFWSGLSSSDSIGYLAPFQAAVPPSNAEAFLIPFCII